MIGHRSFLAVVLALLTVSCVAADDIYKEATSSKVEKTVEASYFGTHFHRLFLDENHKARGFIRTEWPVQPIGAVRLWDTRTRWAEIVPVAGQWNFDRLDYYVEKAAAKGSRILYTLGSTPRWASARPDEKCSYGLGCGAETVRIAHWEEYVRRIAERYRGRVTMYELWNEPAFSDIPRDKGKHGFFTGSIPQMVDMARAARKVLDEIDPAAVLSTPGFVNGPDRLEKFLAAGGKDVVQAIAYHFYSGNSEQFVRQLLDVRAVMRRQGVEHLPLWNTETGIEVFPPDQPMPPGAKIRQTPDTAAFRMAQFLVLGAAAGLEHFFYYSWDNEHSGVVALDGAPLPALKAYEKAYSWLLGARLRGCQSLPPSGVRCTGELDGKEFLVVWAESEGNHELPISAKSSSARVERLLSEEAESIQIQGGVVRIRLGLEPIRILLEPKS